MPGPAPKRSDQRRRRNKDGHAVTKAPSGQPAETEDDLWYPPASHWHEIATQWYLSLPESGQSAFYESSDVATAYYLAEVMSRSLAGRISGQLVATVFSAMTDLLTTEGARRRARLELEREQPDEGVNPVVTAMDRYRQIAADAS